MNKLKKLLALALVVCMVCAVNTTAWASESEEGAVTKSDSDYIAIAAQAHSSKIGMPIEIVEYEVSQHDSLTLCTMIVQPKSGSRTFLEAKYAVDTWIKDDVVIGDIYAIADFDYTGSSATVEDYYYTVGSTEEGASVNVTNETWSHSGTFNKAYYKISYSINYENTSKSRTLEVNCSNKGVVGGNGGMRDF